MRANPLTWKAVDLWRGDGFSIEKNEWAYHLRHDIMGYIGFYKTLNEAKEGAELQKEEYS